MQTLRIVASCDRLFFAAVQDRYAVAARGGPRLFSETVDEDATRGFIIACENQVPQTRQKRDNHACIVQASPGEQKRQAADIGTNGPPYRPTVFEPSGWTIPTEFVSFVKLGEFGAEPNQTFNDRASSQTIVGRSPVSAQTNGASEQDVDAADAALFQQVTAHKAIQTLPGNEVTN